MNITLWAYPIKEYSTELTMKFQGMSCPPLMVHEASRVQLLSWRVWLPWDLEVMACSEGLALVDDHLLQRVRVALDCFNVIRSIQDKGNGSYGHTIQELKARAPCFELAGFVHEGKSSNGDPHSLGRSSIYLDMGPHVWFQTPPEGICMQYNTIWINGW
jgi:hypothetical protein